MQTKTIGQLTTLTSLDSTDLVLMEQDGVTGGATLAEIMESGVPFTEGINLTSGRVAFQEITSGTLSPAGWYTIAESDATSFEVLSAMFSIGVRGANRVSDTSFVVNFSCGTTAKTHENNTIKYLAKSSNSTGGENGVRVAKSDSVSDSGIKIQVYLNVATTVKAVINISQNKAAINTGSSSGLQLVTPYLDNTPTLPDGATAGDFLVAGEELSFPSTVCPLPNMVGFRLSDNSIRCTIAWGEIPYNGTAMTLTFPSTNIQIINGAATIVTITAATIASIVFLGNNNIQFDLNATNIALGLGDSALHFRTNGTGGKLTLS